MYGKADNSASDLNNVEEEVPFILSRQERHRFISSGCEGSFTSGASMNLK